MLVVANCHRARSVVIVWRSSRGIHFVAWMPSVSSVGPSPARSAHCAIPGPAGGGQLVPPQTGVGSALVQQGTVRALLDHLSGVQDQDVVDGLETGQTVGDQ